jgi:hypothetical protein
MFRPGKSVLHLRCARQALPRRQPQQSPIDRITGVPCSILFLHGLGREASIRFKEGRYDPIHTYRRDHLLRAPAGRCGFLEAHQVTCGDLFLIGKLLLAPWGSISEFHEQAN